VRGRAPSRLRSRLALLLPLALAPFAQHRAAGAEAPALRFTPVPGAAGIDLVMTSGEMPSRHILEVNGGGIALLDYDHDGDLDVFIANGATLASPRRGPGSRLYANLGDGTFEDVTERVGLDVRCWAMGAAVGDYDGDGWDDLYVTCHGPNVLLRNVAGTGGGRRFVDVTSAAGVAGSAWSTSAAFADLDGDGDLDLYVANYLDFDVANPPGRAGNAFKGVVVMPGPRGLTAQQDVLYENLGDGRFRDVTRAAGVEVNEGLDYGLAVRIFDYDGDGRPDLFVGNDSTADRLFRNRGGLRFEEVGVTAGVAASGLGTPQATMGVGLADVGGNGHPDLFVTVFSDDTNTLHLNLGDGFFDDRSAQLGLAAPSRPYLGWGCGFYDFDLDGDEDLFIANGHVFPEMDEPEVGGAWAQRPLLFERRGRRFEPAGCDAPWCEQRHHGRAAAFGDLDGDLDVDVLMTTLNGPVLVLRNDVTGRRALVVRLEGRPPNHRAFGSVVEVESGGVTQRRWVTGGGSFQSVDAADAYFGLGEGTGEPGKVEVRVTWPDGGATAFAGVPADRLLVVRRPAAGRRVEETGASPPRPATAGS
jgi:enediyne biosynthesis protein E4